jgi:hypothetical protein
MLILSVVMFFEILFVFGTIQMILLLNVCLPLCMVLLIRISAKKFGMLWIILRFLIMTRGFALGILMLSHRLMIN